MQLRKSPHFQVKNYVFQTFRKHYSSLVAHISHIYLLNPVFFFIFYVMLSFLCLTLYGLSFRWFYCKLIEY